MDTEVDYTWVEKWLIILLGRGVALGAVKLGGVKQSPKKKAPSSSGRGGVVEWVGCPAYSGHGEKSGLKKILPSLLIDKKSCVKGRKVVERKLSGQQVHSYRGGPSKKKEREGVPVIDPFVDLEGLQEKKKRRKGL